MRKLTFEGFLKQYVAELSGVQTASIHKLATGGVSLDYVVDIH